MTMRLPRNPMGHRGIIILNGRRAKQVDKPDSVRCVASHVP